MIFFSGVRLSSPLIKMKRVPKIVSRMHVDCYISTHCLDNLFIKYERFIDCMICVMKKSCVLHIRKERCGKNCVADLRIRFCYIVASLNFLNPKFQLSRCCLLNLVGNLEGRFCRAWVYKFFTCDIRHICLLACTCINLSSAIYMEGDIKDID